MLAISVTHFSVPQPWSVRNFVYKAVLRIATAQMAGSDDRPAICF